MGAVLSARHGLLHYADGLLLALAEYWRVMRLEKELFLGSGLLLVGLLNFESGKYCDGNTADYLSCTRPATYYYFDTFGILLIIAGVFLVMLWLLRRKEQ